jgi:hypothetical protein
VSDLVLFLVSNLKTFNAVVKLYFLLDCVLLSLRVLSQHVYQSLAETQIKREEEIASNPLSRPVMEVEQTPAKILYQAVLPSLPQYTIGLLKILLAAAPTSKAKTDSINIMTYVLPEEMPMTAMQSMIVCIDVHRPRRSLLKRSLRFFCCSSNIL